MRGDGDVSNKQNMIKTRHEHHGPSFGEDAERLSVVALTF